jgi:histidyl-tRNA synthetase
MISLLAGFYRELGLRDVTLLLNSMGDAPSRDAYRAVLLDHWRAHAATLGDDMERAELNPLRILDSKRPDLQDVIAEAPRLGDYLNETSATHFARVQDGLSALGVPFTLAPRLVRGLDYYTSTVFEFASGALDAAQNGIGGGGRYDRLAEEMGGPPTPSIGFGSGVERILLACDAEGVQAAPNARVDVFVVDPAGTSDASLVLGELREHGFAADRSYGSRALKRQMSAANSSGATWTVILGEKEAARGMVAVKDMLSGEQCEVGRDALVAWLQDQKGTDAQ